MQSISACNIDYSPIAALFYSDSNIQSGIQSSSSLNDLAMDVLFLLSLHELSLKISPRGYLLLTLMIKLLTNLYCKH